MKKRNLKIICFIVAVFMMLSALTFTATAADTCLDHWQCSAGGVAYHCGLRGHPTDYYLSSYTETTGPTNSFCKQVKTYYTYDCMCALKTRTVLYSTTTYNHQLIRIPPIGQFECQLCFFVF